MRWWQSQWLLAGAVALAAGACRESTVETATTAATPSDLSQLVVGEAAARLDASGKFVMPAPSAEAMPALPSISEKQAREFAALFARDFGPMLRPALERHRGGRIEFDQLVLCGRVFYAESPLSDLPGEVPDAVRRGYGPYWLVTLCERGAPALSVAVSAYASDLRIVNGRLRFPLVSGNEFVPHGIPKYLGALPLPPEEAVRIASASGIPVADVPHLVAPMRRSEGVPQMGRWRVTFAKPVQVRGKTSGKTQTRADVFIRRRFFRDPIMVEIPAFDAPAVFAAKWSKRVASPKDQTHGGFDSVVVAPKRGHAIRYEQATLAERVKP